MAKPQDPALVPGVSEEIRLHAEGAAQPDVRRRREAALVDAGRARAKADRRIVEGGVFFGRNKE